MKIQQLKKFLAKALSQLCLILLLVIFAAAAEGALPIFAALLLGVVDVVLLNILCGVLLVEPTESAVPQPAQPTQIVYRPRRAPLRPAALHSGRVA